MAAPDLGERAWENMLPQHRGKPLLEGWVRSVFAPLTAALETAEALRSRTSIEDAYGPRLDLVASIVGAGREVPDGVVLAYFGFDDQPGATGFEQARFRDEGDPIATTYTMPDAEFRAMVRAKVALNNGRGTRGQLEAAAAEAFQAPTASARNAGDATVELWIGREPDPRDPLAIAIPPLFSSAAGVGLRIVFFSPELPFGFAENGHFGFEVGIISDVVAFV